VRRGGWYAVEWTTAETAEKMNSDVCLEQEGSFIRIHAGKPPPQPKAVHSRQRCRLRAHKRNE
jgi:hypothetical protein